MVLIAICLNREFCNWSCELDQEAYEKFEHQCPDCYGPAVTYNSKSQLKEEEDEIFGFLLPLIVGEAGYSEESME